MDAKLNFGIRRLKERDGMWGQGRRARGQRVWLEEPGSLRGAARVGVKDRIAQAGCHRQKVDPTGKGRAPQPRDADKGRQHGRGDQDRLRAAGRGLHEGATARAKGSGGRRRWNSAESAPRPLGGTCGNPAAARPGRGSGRAQRRERRL